MSTITTFTESDRKRFLDTILMGVVQEFVDTRRAFLHSSIFDESNEFNQFPEKFKTLKAVVTFLESSSEFLFLAKVGDEETGSVKFHLNSDFGETPDLSVLDSETVSIFLKVVEFEYPLTQQLKKMMLQLPILQTVD